MKEYFMVVNPTAAGGRVHTQWTEKIKPLLDEKHIEYDFQLTENPLQAIDIARTKVNEGYKIICSVGGDGTANEVVNGILKAEKPGIFSAFAIGTGNDIPTTYGIPEMDIEAAFDCLINGMDKKFDIGYCEKADRYFVGVASMGFDAEVANRVNKGSKKRSGTRNYQIAIIETLVKFKPYELVITPDNDPPITGPRMLLAIGNGKRYGAGMHVCPSAEITDGKFAGATMLKINRIGLLRLFPKVYDGKHIGHKKVQTFTGTEVYVDSPKKKCLYQVDGEILGYLPERFITKPNFVTVRVPNPWRSYSEIWQEKLTKKSK
ncbi:MAG: diacylglycerol kinase family lipid kinase [Candidatus Heimdallarchaeota archaeon]|nr:diacylglycerol kinase family lipid kinase [Candidatus Heimdallarchaeota archaeon]